MKIQKQRVKVKIKTVSSTAIGQAHTMVGGRLSDYMTSHVNKFIPVTNAVVYPIGKDITEDAVKREVVFVNVEMIEMIEYL